MNETEGWKAYVEDSADGWALGVVRLVVARPVYNGAEFLTPAGTTIVVDPAVVPPDDVRFTIPRGAVEAIAAAIARWQGDASHAATEVRVLREWLLAERQRVDDHLASRP